MGDRFFRAGKPSRYVTSLLGRLSLLYFRVGKTKNSFGWEGKGMVHTARGKKRGWQWQGTLCDPLQRLPYLSASVMRLAHKKCPLPLLLLLLLLLLIFFVKTS